MSGNPKINSTASAGGCRWARLAAMSALCLSVSAGCAALSGRPPAGQKETLSAEQKAAIAKVRASVKALIVWSSSRYGNHDLLLMSTAGGPIRRLTKGKHVDWYPRFSPDGKRVLFTRSKRGWVGERDANRPDKWDTYVIAVDGGKPERVAASASWATWIDDDNILFSRKTKIFRKNLESSEEQLVVDSTQIDVLGGGDLQSPHLSPDGKHLAITLRGAKRETGLLELATKRWTVTGRGAGCQINWFPSGDRIIWVNPSGNGGSELFSIPVTDGEPTRKYSYEEMRYMDIPGRRSHEYFPQLDRSGHWLIWAATRRGHDHDIADYEIYIWKVGSPKSEATRLTFHSANDRWPDIFVTGSAK